MEETLNMLDTFPAFSPYSAGSYNEKARLTIQTINKTLPALRDLAKSLGKLPPPLVPIETVALTEEDRLSAARLKDLRSAR